MFYEELNAPSTLLNSDIIPENGIASSSNLSKAERIARKVFVNLNEHCSNLDKLSEENSFSWSIALNNDCENISAVCQKVLNNEIDNGVTLLVQISKPLSEIMDRLKFTNLTQSDSLNLVWQKLHLTLIKIDEAILLKSYLSLKQSPKNHQIVNVNKELINFKNKHIPQFNAYNEVKIEEACWKLNSPGKIAIIALYCLGVLQ